MVVFINKKDTKDKLIGDLWESFNSCVTYENNPILPKSYIFMKWLKDSIRDKYFKYAMKLSVPTTGLITIAMFILFKDMHPMGTFLAISIAVIISKTL